MAEYVPPGWPTGVHPPGSEGFERTAVAWLLDVVPPDYRLYGVLRRHPVALAALARHHLAACVDGARQGYRMARTELGDVLPAHGLDAVLAAYRSEGRRLVATARAADLVARALRGEVFVPRLRDSDDAGQPARPGPPGRPTRPGQPGQPALPAPPGQATPTGQPAQPKAGQAGRTRRPAGQGDSHRPAPETSAVGRRGPAPTARPADRR